MPKNCLNPANSGLCPITIIQAPITVNGDTSLNVHQSIVLSSKKHKISSDVTSENKHLSSVISKQRQGCEVGLKRPNRTSNPYAKKFSKIHKKRKADTQLSSYSNRAGEEYTVTSSYSKRN